MPSNEVQSVRNIRNSAEFETSLAEAQKKDLLTIMLEIAEDDARFHQGRLVNHVKSSYQLIDRQEEKNLKSVKAKQESSKFLDTCSCVCSFVGGLAGGPMSTGGAMFQAVGQAFQNVSSMEGQRRQGNASNEDFHVQRLEKLFNEDSQGKQGADKGLIDCRQIAKAALDTKDGALHKLFGN